MNIRICKNYYKYIGALVISQQYTLKITNNGWQKQKKLIDSKKAKKLTKKAILNIIKETFIETRNHDTNRIFSAILWTKTRDFDENFDDSYGEKCTG